MDPTSEFFSRDKVLSDINLVAEIILKVGSSKSMINCSAVNTIWLAAKKNPIFARRFAERNFPVCLGFIVEFQQRDNPPTTVHRLLFPLPSVGEESAVALRPRVDPLLLAGDKVLASIDGTLLTAGHEVDEPPTMYYTSSPTDEPRIYEAVAGIIPRIPVVQGQYSKNTFGQFGVVSTPRPERMSFFVKDAADYPFCTYGGVSFCSKEDIFVHVCVFNDGMWVRHVSPGIESPTSALFHRNPYSVLDGDRLFMMYVVGYIVCFNLATSLFTVITLPGDLIRKVRSWHDYTVVHHTEGGLALVHYWHGKLDTWLLTTINGLTTWSLESSIDLVDNFVPIIPLPIWARLFGREAFPLGTDHYFSFQVRAASKNARFVLATLGFDQGLYMVDMVNRSVGHMSRSYVDGNIGHVFPLMETWPPKE